MPATDVGWSFGEKLPIYQIYGTKRKNSETFPSPPAIETEMSAAKRFCAGIQDESDDCTMGDTDPPQSSPLTSQHTPSQPTFGSHTTNSSQMTLQEPAAIQWSTFPDVALPDCVQNDHTLETNNNNNNNLAGPPSAPSSQNDMIMDLHDETYSTARLPSMTTEPESGSCDMEGEGAPNPSQYNSQAYCDPYCVGGNASPSGRVRCFCKPSWEGMLDMRPYVSDYY